MRTPAFPAVLAYLILTALQARKARGQQALGSDQVSVGSTALARGRVHKRRTANPGMLSALFRARPWDWVLSLSVSCSSFALKNDARFRQKGLV